MSAAVVSRLLRAPAEVAASCREDRDIRAIALASLGAIALGSAVFGAVIGSFRGKEQILYAAVKVPLAMLITLALCAPAFHALAAVLGRPWPMRSIIALVLASAGRSSLVLLAFAPVLWLLIDLGLGYHASSVAAWLAYAAAGLAALGVLVRGIGAGQGRGLTAVAFMAVFFAVGGQAAWMLRPYLGRPSQKEIPFVRAREGSFSDALVRSCRSALGIYDEDPRSLERRHKARSSSDPPGGSPADVATPVGPIPVDDDAARVGPTEAAR
ncbi:hypothetical protein [Sorangium sp. So ce341]|uniref:hypothetical protein n=1 Tax=Sorangium sp. So ce341 TaxID=3133302 RepID=UPI003F60E7EF